MQQFHAVVSDTNIINVSLFDLTNQREAVRNSLLQCWFNLIGQADKNARLSIAETVSKSKLLKWIDTCWEESHSGDFPFNPAFVAVNLHNGDVLMFQIYSDTRTNIFAEELRAGMDWDANIR